MSSPCKLCLRKQDDLKHLARDDMMVCYEHFGTLADDFAEAKKMNTILMVELAIYREAAESSAALACAIDNKEAFDQKVADRYTLAWEKVAELTKKGKT